MAVSFTGPVLQRSGAANNPRAAYGGAPVSFDPDYLVFVDDFIGDVNPAMWTLTVKDTGATVAITANQKNGVLAITSAATTDDDGGAAFTANQFVKLDTDAWFKARVKTSDATQSEIFVGLSASFATNPENVLSAVRAGFQKADGSTRLKFYTKHGSNETSFDTGVDIANDTFVNLAFKVSNGEIWVYINDNYVGRTSTYVTTDVVGPAVFQLSGDNVGTKVLTVDYVAVGTKRV